MSALQQPTAASEPGVGADPRGTAPAVFHARTLLLGAVLVACLAYVAPYTDLVVGQLQMGVLQLAPGAVGPFLLLYAGIRGAQRLGRLRWMSAADLLALYLMLLVAVFVTTRGLLEKLIPALVYLNYFAAPGNSYRSFFLPHVRPGLVAFAPQGPRRQEVAVGFFEGARHGPIPWHLWGTPLLAWSLLFGLVVWCLLCLSVLLRRQWADVEKLSFPLTALPLRLLDGGQAVLFRSPLTWIGVAIPTVVYTVNGLHQLAPTVPEIPTSFWDVQHVFTAPPWNQMGAVGVFISFAAMGIAYFLPSDLLFSIWFFFVLTRVGDVAAASLGIRPDQMPSFPTATYIGYQAIGAYVTLAMLFFHSGRHSYRQILRDGLRGAPGVAGEMLSPRVAVWGLLLGFGGVAGWCVWAGMSLWLAVGVWLLYLFVSCLVLARGVSEAGLLMTESSFYPSDIIGMLVPKSAWGAGNWTVLSLLNAVFFRDLRGSFLALFLDGQQLSDGVRMRRRHLPAPLAVAFLVALPVGIVSHLSLSYAHGAQSLYSYGTWLSGFTLGQSEAVLNHTGETPASGPLWFGVGVAVTLVLTLLRSRIVGFPLHPLAYALAPTWTAFVLSFSFFVMWTVKSLILHYGGYRLYRRLIPFFLGLILGEFGSAALWAVLAATTHVMAPTFPWP